MTVPGCLSATMLASSNLMLGGTQSVAVGGTGYTVGDILTFVGGTSTTSAAVTVATVLVAAGSFTVGSSYTIVAAGSTDFTLIGAANNNVGTTFTASGAGSGSGTASTATAAEVGAAYTVTAQTTGKYTKTPTSPVSTTGGTGTSATITAGWSVWTSSGSGSSYTLTAGYFDDQESETQYGLNPAVPMGSILPLTLHGETIITLVSITDSVTPGDSATYLEVDAVVAQSFFISITVNEVTLNSSEATFSTGALTQWRWIGSLPIDAETDYSVTIT